MLTENIKNEGDEGKVKEEGIVSKAVKEAVVRMENTAGKIRKTEGGKGRR